MRTAELLTVSIAHGSLTHRPFLENLPQFFFISFGRRHALERFEVLHDVTAETTAGGGALA